MLNYNLHSIIKLNFFSGEIIIFIKFQITFHIIVTISTKHHDIIVVIFFFSYNQILNHLINPKFFFINLFIIKLNFDELLIQVPFIFFEPLLLSLI